MAKNISSLIVIVLFFFAANTLAQTSEVSYMDCYYRMSFKKDTTQQVLTDDLMTLRIGRYSSLFYSNNSYLIDSLLTSPSGKSMQMDIIANGAGKYGKRIVSYTILKNISNGELIFTDNVGGDHYRYTEQTPMLQWKILNDRKTISEFKCQKATCTFRGREYVAWFATDLPISNGPWKFQGLPGLILEVHDVNNEYSFVYVGHSSSCARIELLPHKYISTSRSKYQKAYRNYIKDPVGYITAASGMTITLSESKKREIALRKLNYDLIEKE